MIFHRPWLFHQKHMRSAWECHPGVLATPIDRSLCSRGQHRNPGPGGHNWLWVQLRWGLSQRHGVGEGLGRGLLARAGLPASGRQRHPLAALQFTRGGLSQHPSPHNPPVAGGSEGSWCRHTHTLHRLPPTDSHKDLNHMKMHL